MNVWQELRRRRVFRVAGLYIVGAWLVIQVADILFPAWGLPETALRFLFIAAAAGFPIALVFGWFYDITSQGVIRTEPAAYAESADLSLKRKDYVILVALIAIGISILAGSLAGMWDEVAPTPSKADIERRANSIAVLPFANLDPNPDTGYFSDGVTEEILHRLSTQGTLHVLASTSSFTFRDSNMSPAEITGRLGVRYLLQGSVRRDVDHVRVTARLLDETGFQLWSDSFDRKLEGIFTIQTEIASAVSGHIISEIVPIDELPAGRTTQNMEAYSAYLQGRAYFDSRTTGWRDNATAAFRRAIQLDPDFAPPYAGLAAATTVVTGSGPHWEEGRALAEQALALDPDLAFGHAVRGFINFILGLDNHDSESLDYGLLSLRRAIELDPSLPVTYAWLSWALWNMDRVEEANEVMQRGLEVDPLNPLLVHNSAESEILAGNLERAEALILRLTTLPNPPPHVLPLLTDLYEVQGRHMERIDSLKQSIRLDPEAADTHSMRLAWAYASLGLFDEAGHWDNLFRRQRPDDADPYIASTYQFSQLHDQQSALADELRQIDALLDSGGDTDGQMGVHLFYWAGLAHIRLGYHGKGISYLERHLDRLRQTMSLDDSADLSEILERWRRQHFSRVWGYRMTYNFVTQLAFAYQQVGRKDDASRVLQAIDLTYVPGSGFYLPLTAVSPVVLQDKALHRALSGDTVGALEALRQAVRLGAIDYYGMINNPAWAATITRPEFQQVLAEAKAEIDRQRAVVEAIDAENDFRAEVEAMLSQ